MLLIPLALAHSPHDVTSVVSVAPDGAVATVEDDAIALSPDGREVAWFGFPFAEPSCVFALGGDTVVALAPGEGAWITPDAGASWSFAGGPVEARRCTRAGEVLVVAAADGVWTSDDGAEWSPLGPAPLFGARDVAIDPAGAPGASVFLVQDDGVAYALDAEEAGWAPLSLGPYRTVAAGGGVALLAPERGPLQVVVDGVPQAVDGAPADVRAVAVAPDGAWLAATATEAVWVSRDGGAGWALEAEGLEVLATGSGAPEDGVHYDELVATDDAWWLASWEGLFGRAPEEARWSQVPLRTIPLVNVLHWLGDELLVGTNGGGLYRGVPGTSTWTDVSAAIGWPWTRQLAVSPDGASWFVGAGNVIYISHDQGASWDVPPSRLPTGGDVVLVSPGFAEDREVLFAGVDAEGRSAVAWSADAGATWNPVPLPGECGAKPGWGARTATWAWVTCHDELYASDDGGRSWTGSGRLGSEPVALVPDGDGAVWIAAEAGLHRAEGAGAPTLVGFGGDFLTAMATLPDGAPLVAVRGAGLATLDGPVPGWPAAEPVEFLAISPDGAVAVGSHLGLSLSTDGGATFAPACPYDRYDDRDQAFVRDGWTEAEDRRSKAQSVSVGGVGAVATWEVEGEGVALWGGADAATLEVTVDGFLEVVEVRGARTPSLLWSATLDPGWHEVTVRVTGGELRLDGGERWRWDAPYDPPDDDTGGAADDPGARACGCGGGSAGALGVLALWGLRRRRSAGAASRA